MKEINRAHDENTTASREWPRVLLAMQRPYIPHSRIALMKLAARALCLFFMIPASLLAEVDPSRWQVVDVSSENALTGEVVYNAIDGNPETQWHTRWHAVRHPEPATPPHSLTIDFRETHPVTAIRIRTRAHGQGGLPHEYKLELGASQADLITVARGEAVYRSELSPHVLITLDKPYPAQFLRLTINSVYPSAKAMEPGLVISELDVASFGTPLVPTTLLPVRASRQWNHGGYNWQSRHDNLLTYIAKHHPRLIFVGDSITHRWETEGTGKEVWAHYYGHRNAVNLGFGWDRLENILWRLRHGELEQANPRLVVVMAGTNNLEVNTPQEIAAGIEGVCDEIHQQKPNAHILLLAIFPRGETGTTPELSQANILISDLEQRDYVTFRDIGHVFRNKEDQLTRDIMPDLLHPNQEGYRRWAETIEPDVARILGDEPVVTSIKAEPDSNTSDSPDHMAIAPGLHIAQID